MLRNRDYTGPERTPPSMAWLFRERAKSKGNIDRRRKLLVSLPREIESNEKSSEALELVIRPHDVRVDPNALVGKREHKLRLTDHGSVARGIYRALREADVEPLLTMEAALAVAPEDC